MSANSATEKDFAAFADFGVVFFFGAAVFLAGAAAFLAGAAAFLALAAPFVWDFFEGFFCSFFDHI
jgi:hypothetical protein